MAQRITSQVGVTQVVKLRLDPTPARVEVLRGYCGTARAVYNILLFRLRANLGQRAAERSYGIADGDLTPALSWQKYSLEKLLREHRDDWLPWWREVPWQVLDVPAHQLAVALARFKTGAGRFPTFKRKHGPGAGLVPVTFHLTRSNRRVVPIRVAAVGVDAGLGKHFATLGTPIAGLTDLAGHIPAPRHLRRALADLAAAQRWLKRTTPGSVRHAKALARVQKLHGRTAGRRDSWQQHLAIGLTEHATVVDRTVVLSRRCSRVCRLAGQRVPDPVCAVA